MVFVFCNHNHPYLPEDVSKRLTTGPFQKLSRKSINSWKHVSCLMEEAKPRPGFSGLGDNLGRRSLGEAGVWSRGDGARLGGGPLLFRVETGAL